MYELRRLSILLIISLAGCGGGGSDGSLSDSGSVGNEIDYDAIEYEWYIQLSQSVNLNNLYASASYGKSTYFYTSPNSSFGCSVRSNSKESTSSFRSISRIDSSDGSVILTSSAGTYLTFGFDLEPDWEPDLPVPQDLVVDIPQSGLFAGIPVPFVEPFVALPPTDLANITLASELKWEEYVNRKPSDFLILNVYLEGELDDSDVFCTVEDDGSFTFPESVQNELAGYEFSRMTFTRHIASETVEEDTLLTINSLSSYYY